MSSDSIRDFSRDAAAWDENPGRVRLASQVAAAIVEEARPHRRMNVLDFGCGTGLMSLPWADRVGHLSGADSAQGMLDVFSAKAEEMGLVERVRTILVDETLHALHGPYDLIVSSMTLHHIRDLATLFARFFAELSPGGKVCLADLDPDEGLFHEDNQGVFHFGFDRSAMSGLLCAAGFVPVAECTASEVVKPTPNGPRRFSVFLISAEKPT